MRWWTKKAFVAVSAVLGILVYSMQFKKSCEDASPYACVMSLVSWVGHGMLTPRDVAAKSPQQKPAPDAIKKRQWPIRPKPRPHFQWPPELGLPSQTMGVTGAWR